MASLGKYGGPLWWARCGPLAGVVGPHDPAFGQPRSDGYLSDGVGSLYAILSLLLPGFGAFRFPSKVLPLAMAAMGALAGTGWDRVMEGGAESRRLANLGVAGLGVSLSGLILAIAVRSQAVAWLASHVPADPLVWPRGRRRRPGSIRSGLWCTEPSSSPALWGWLAGDRGAPSPAA